MKYLPSVMIGQLSGKAGSNVASRNRYGSYFRNKAMPTNPNTPKQSAQRSIMTSLSQGWRTLTDSQRAGWAALGSQMVRNDSLGATYTLTGIQAYTSVNRTLAVIGAAVVSDAPSYTPPASLYSVTLTATA